ncbi:MAG: inositol-3-phosphate synthase, partial [Ignavibacteriae bacterium]|nr:inositol-3-phosphate synthase [Ignavibacteriota bacterium]
MNNVSPASGRLGVMIVGLNGAVSTTFIAGTYAVRRNLTEPIGSLTQMGTVRIGRRHENRFPLLKELVPLADLDQLVFGGWDIRNEDCYYSAREAKVLEERDLVPVQRELAELRPLPGVFEQYYVKRLTGDWVKKGKTKFDLAEQLREDIISFKRENKLDRLVMLWCGSTE